MASASVTETDLTALGIIPNYIWKPQRLFIKNTNPEFGGEYIAADIVSDGTAEDIQDAVINEGQSQIDQISRLANEQKTQISRYERDYTTVKSNLQSTYQRMYNYYMGQGLVALATIMATAIVNLSYT